MLEAIGVIVVAAPLVFLLTLVSVLWRAWWLYPAWAWLIVPLGAPTISFWHFSALLMLAASVASNNDAHEDTRPVDWSKVIFILLLPVLTWAVVRWLVR